MKLRVSGHFEKQDQFQGSLPKIYIPNDTKNSHYFTSICSKLFPHLENGFKADLHGTTLSHKTSLRQAYDMNCFWQLAYDCRVGLTSRRRPTASLLCVTKSAFRNRKAI